MNRHILGSHTILISYSPDDPDGDSVSSVSIGGVRIFTYVRDLLDECHDF